MNVNFTLLVQAINFFIAYFLFRFIILKPGYQMIVQEKKYKEDLESLVEKDRVLLEEKKLERQAQWISCKQYCKEYIPKLPDETALFRGIVPRVSITPLSDQDLHEMKDRIANTIISLVGAPGDRT